MNNMIDSLCQLPQTMHLQALCDLAYRILGNPVFVCDLAHTILGYTKCVDITDPIWQSDIVNGRLERNTLQQDREVAIVHKGSTGDHRPVLVTDNHIDYPRLIKVLMNKGQAVGVLVATAYLKPLEEEDVGLVELISSFVVQSLLSEKHFVSDERHSIENYIIKILDGEPVTGEQVKERLSFLGFVEKTYTYVLCIGVGYEESQQPPSRISDILNVFRRHENCCVFPYNSCLVCIYGSDTDVNDWEKYAPELTELMKREGLQAGVSRRIQGVQNLRFFYLQAADALEMGVRLVRHDRYLLYDSLSCFGLFRMMPIREVDRYCHERIRGLGEYDKLHGTDLCMTLQVYLEQAKSLAKTSELLFIHRNTVRYRIKKCMELMNTDLEDGNDIFAYIFSLRILEFLRKFPRKID